MYLSGVTIQYCMLFLKCQLQVSEGLWVNPGVPEAMQQAEATRLVNTYGKFWNTWQFDRGAWLYCALASVGASLYSG